MGPLGAGCAECSGTGGPPSAGTRRRPASPVFEETAPAPHGSGSPAEEAGRQKSICARILARLNLSPTDEDALLRDLGIPAAEGAQELLALELGGEVQRSGGGFIHRN
ncbi:DprA-like winged helix domain-containing protein [Paracoccus cavernae]|uniref:DprA-like winged helix domain-containing protein n=1 Tax=Paracoccus cavernae TaxID=1571207 RepID=UPI003636335F